MPGPLEACDQLCFRAQQFQGIFNSSTQHAKHSPNHPRTEFLALIEWNKTRI